MGLSGTKLQLSPDFRASQLRLEPSYRSQPWYRAYMDALFEADRSKVRDRIRRAEQLMLRREQELFSRSPDIDEQRALNNALHALHAFSACMK